MDLINVELTWPEFCFILERMPDYDVIANDEMVNNLIEKLEGIWEDAA